MPESVYLEIEDNENCEYMPLQVYEARSSPTQVHRIRLFEPDRPHGVYRVTGWSSEGSGGPCPAMYAPVSDSGQAVAHLVYGGDWGVRLKPVDSDEEWDVNSPSQWGEPYLVLTDEHDILPNGEGSAGP
jgi:hypothetical protein